MTRDKKILTGIVITTIVILMLRKKIYTALNTTPFGAISDKLFNLIAKFEGYVSVPVWDYLQYSVGYGSGYNWDEKRRVIKTDIINKETASRWLLEEAKKKYDFVVSKVKVPVNENQLLAMSSFTYNVGEGAFSNSNLLKLLNLNADKQLVANEFDKWRIAGGKVNPGLVNRRAAEKKLFLS